ncbi:MAG: lysostaphin resistance A-like protein, partial [Haloarculaceae archaeon]
ELVVRGYLMTNLAEGLNGLGPLDADRALAVSGLLTSALFGVLHASNPNATAVSTLNIAVVGVFFAVTYALTERLGVAIGLHLTWNWSVGSLYGLPVSGITTGGSILAIEERGPDWATGGPFGPEAGVVVLIALAVATVLLVWWVRRQYGTVTLREAVAVPALRIDAGDGRPDDGDARTDDVSASGGTDGAVSDTATADTPNRDG